MSQARDCLLAAAAEPSAPPPSAPPDLEAPTDAFAPSAPPLPTVLTPGEFQVLLGKLSRGSSEYPAPNQLRTFRAFTMDRLLWTAQARELVRLVDGGTHMLREAYERQLLADPASLDASDGAWVQAMWMPGAGIGSGPAAQAFLIPVTVTRFDGQNITIAVDPSVTNVGQAMVLAANQQSISFDPEVHSAWAVNAPTPNLVKGSLVKLTGLVSGEALNGVVGQILQVNNRGDETYDVITPAGQYRVTPDNVVPMSATVVSRNPACLVGLSTPLSNLGQQARLLWLEKGSWAAFGIGAKVEIAGLTSESGQLLNGQQGRISKVIEERGRFEVCLKTGRVVSLPKENLMSMADPKPHKQAARGVCQAIKNQYFAMDTDGDHQVSAGEFRNFLWNLHLSDAQFEKVMERFSPAQSNAGVHYLDLEMMLFLLGRPHIMAPEVPIDALLYEAVVGIIDRRTTAHIDKDLSQADAGVGHRAACAAHCVSYFVSFVLAWVARLSLVAVVLLGSDGQDPSQALGVFGVAYILYLLQVFCCVRLSSAFQNETHGIEHVMEKMDRPHYENPHYHWHVECYHYVTVHYTETERDSEGNTRTVHKTRQEKRVTHTASFSGVIPSTDCSPPFVPQTTAQQTQITTSLVCDFSNSNYHDRYRAWCLFHHRDVHQTAGHSEDLPSRLASLLAVWVAKPWWMGQGYYVCTTLCLASCAYRWFAQARMGEQEYSYLKKCYSI